MKQVILQIPDNKYLFFLELVKNLSFVEKIEEKPVAIEEKVPTKEEIFQGIRDAFKEVEEIRTGRKKATTLNEFLNEL